MTIINKHAYTHLTHLPQSDPIQYRNSPNLLRLLPLDENSKYWFAEFTDIPALTHLSKAIPEHILDQIINGAVSLILSNTHEAYHRVIEEIYKVAVYELNIPEDNIIFVTESADADKAVLKFASFFSKKHIKVIWVRIFENDINSHARRKFEITPTLEYKPYEKKFLNFNRRWRLQRPTFVGLLTAKNLLNSGYVSLAPSDDQQTWNTIWPLVIHYNSMPYNQSVPELTELLETHKEQIINLPPMYIDTLELVENKADPLPSTDKYYSSTYFSIVNETNFYTTLPGFESGRFFSEKTFKPILERHPFLLIAPPNSLDLLRQLGYRTFDSIIDETYDIEPNDSKRLMLILNETERLCNLNETELREFLVKAREICDFNFNCLKNKDIKKDFAQWILT
jgi:hypothetical protein